MKITTASCLWAACLSLAAGAEVRADNVVEPRQATNVDPAASPVPTQAPAITTYYIRSSIGDTVTYAEVIYTQLFASVPDQFPPPGSGSIGYGSLVPQGKDNAKRDASPTPAGFDLVLALPTVFVTQWLMPETRVEVLVALPSHQPSPAAATASAMLGFPTSQHYYTAQRNSTSLVLSNGTAFSFSPAPRDSNLGTTFSTRAQSG